MEISTEDLIGGTVIDALDGSWIEIRLPDGRVVNVEAFATVQEFRNLDRMSSTPVGELVVTEAVDLTV